MATILLTWELGMGLGHLVRLKPIGEALVKRGHRVVAALRDLTFAKQVLGRTGIDYFSAPVALIKDKLPYDPPLGYAHMMGNAGMAEEAAIGALFTRWNAIFDAVRPDLVIVDHSPMVLLTLWGRPIPRVNLGLGFFCPPDTFPLPAWPRFDKVKEDIAVLTRDEQEITTKVNRILRHFWRPSLQRLGQLFNQIDGIFLTTYPEFDHFGPRQGVRYWGHWPMGIGMRPNWPEGPRPRIFSYLKNSPQSQLILKTLKQRAIPVLAYGGGLPLDVQNRFASPLIRFESRPLDLAQVSLGCDLAVTTASHGTVASLVLAGVPCLLTSLVMEQLLFARKVVAQGSATLVPKEPEAIGGAIDKILNDGKYRERARILKDRYESLLLGTQVLEIADRIEGMIRANTRN